MFGKHGEGVGRMLRDVLEGIPGYLGRMDYTAFNIVLHELNIVKSQGSLFMAGMCMVPPRGVHCSGPALIPLFILPFPDSTIH